MAVLFLERISSAFLNWLIEPGIWFDFSEYYYDFPLIEKIEFALRHINLKYIAAVSREGSRNQQRKSSEDASKRSLSTKSLASAAMSRLTSGGSAALTVRAAIKSFGPAPKTFPG
jgi:hypothetical protein